MSEPLDLEPIERRDSESHDVERYQLPSGAQAFRDRRALLAEIKRLRAQIAAVRKLCDRAQMHDHDGFKMTYVSWLRVALGDKPPLPPPNPLLTAPADDTARIPGRRCR